MSNTTTNGTSNTVASHEITNRLMNSFTRITSSLKYDARYAEDFIQDAYLWLLESGNHPVGDIEALELHRLAWSAVNTIRRQRYAQTHRGVQFDEVALSDEYDEECGGVVVGASDVYAFDDEEEDRLAYQAQLRQEVASAVHSLAPHTAEVLETIMAGLKNGNMQMHGHSVSQKWLTQVTGRSRSSVNRAMMVISGRMLPAHQMRRTRSQVLPRRINFGSSACSMA